MTTNKLVHMRIPENLYGKAKKLSEIFGFSTTQEFFRDSLRKSIENYEKEMIIKKLELLKGSEKKIRRMTKQERNKFFEEFAKRDTLDAFWKYGLD
ncbi:MAG: hypothetical protein ISS25_04245 [Nanoarchaeota archaeon]|nr:hypothetical protein [DPANN group archaeon]MBL7117012.1 hypothetical protein [Nanoarchaeota archaeon]